MEHKTSAKGASRAQRQESQRKAPSGSTPTAGTKVGWKPAGGGRGGKELPKVNRPWCRLESRRKQNKGPLEGNIMAIQA